ncbi:MAG TPA: hypothetical protein VE172_22655, partial [Stackebrandtia sp.]|nr:hypothetical protein [Stackebrandtia sp.]
SRWDVAFSLATTRSSFEERAVVFGTDVSEMADDLRALAAGEPTARVVSGTATRGGIAFVCRGSAEAVAREGERLREADARFAAVFATVRDELRGGDASDAASAAFVTQVALHRLLTWWGIAFDHVGGDSAGRAAAGHLTAGNAANDETAYATVISTDPDERGDEAGGVIAAFDPEASPRESVVTVLARAHVRGASVNWRKLFDGTGARVVDLPTYPFQRQRFWVAQDLAAPLET